MSSPMTTMLHLRVIDPEARVDHRLAGVLDVPLDEALTAELTLTLDDGRVFTVLVREEQRDTDGSRIR